MQTEILGIVAHDLRSPVNSIKAIVDLLKTSPVTAEEQVEFYDLIEGACNESDTITNDLMDVARRAENDNLQLNETDLNTFTEEIYEQWLHRIPGKRKFIFLASRQPAFAKLHAQKMQRVFNNLINNAIKFTNDDGSIVIKIEERDNNNIISVRDDGIGIPEHLKPYMFDRFSKAGRSGVNGEKSYGLGLNICKEIVEKHGGKISVKSAENQGTTFYIELPKI